MSQRELLAGPDLPSLESHTFQKLADQVDTHPESVLYLSQQDHPQDATKSRWKEVGPSAALRVDTLDDFVSEYYERDQFKGRVTHIDRPLLFRLVELGVEGIDNPDNPLYTAGSFPSSGLVEEAEAIYTELEFAGLLSPEAMRKRLEREGVDDRALHVEELAEGIEATREEILADEHPETYRTERMHHVTTASQSLEEVFPSVDAVVFSGFTRFDALERDLLGRIVETWPTVALLPLQIDPDNDKAIGVDTGVERALETYLDFDFSLEYADVESDTLDTRQLITRNLYRHPDQAPATDNIRADSLDVTLREPETVPDEIRDVARDIRTKLADDTTPEEVGVVLPSPVQYADRVRELFESYELPFRLKAETPLPETALGDAIQTICQLAQEPRTVDSLLQLVTNPLVTVTHEGGRLDHRELTAVASRVETNRLESTLEHMDNDVATTIDTLLQDIASLSTTPLDDLPAQLDSLLDRLGVTAALSGEHDLSQSLRTREKAARDRLDRVLETLALTDPLAEPNIGDSVDRLERALHGVSIRASNEPPEQRVVVCGLEESLYREFEHVYLLGLTSSHVPTNPEQTAFARPIRDAHPDFEQRDLVAETRSYLGALFGSDATLHLSVPQRSLDGEPYVEADILTELRRLIDVSTLVDEDEMSATEPGCGEDVQQSIGEALGEISEEKGQSLVEQAAAAGTFNSNQVSRINSGVACAAARASPELTPYDGQLSPEMVDRVHEAGEREPYSPSRLETYAACGFKYYMRNVLDIEAPDPLTREPDAGDRGSYLHAVFEHYYRSLQGEEGEPIFPGGDFGTRQERLLTVALDQLDEAFEEYDETSFQTAWLTQILAGLGTPETNPYYGPEAETDEDRPLARGLLYRFVEHEFDEPARTTARPTWFEARIGTPHSGGTSVQSQPANIETPRGIVSIHGLIDRVETVPGTDPTRLVVRDYKTGSNTPSESDVLLGLDFQLPLYALMAEDAFAGVETVGAAYYQVSPPASVNSRSGLLTSQDMAVYHRNDDVDTPLLRHSYPAFETHAGFRQFLEEITPRRLGELADGIKHGRFHPTVLDPADAGCRYCDYAHVCDVRPHQRHDVIEVIDKDDIGAYVPPKARGREIEDVVGGD